MNSDDPNFPKEIPPIPEPQDDGNPASTSDPGKPEGERLSETWDSEEWTDATASGDPDDIPPVDNEAPYPSFNGDDVDYDDSLEQVPGYDSPQGQETPAPEAATPPVTELRGKERPRQAEETVAPPGGAANSNFDDWGQSEVPYQPKELGILDQLLLLLADGAAVWRKGLRWVRSQLPPTWQRRLSDEVMTAIALGLLVLFLALWNPLGSGKSTSPVAETPGSPSAELAEKNASEAALPENETPELAPAPGISNLPETTPEQSVIADIQEKVSDISRAYAAGLIQSVEVNLPQNQLMVNLGENWYGLLDEQQDEVAQSIFEQVQQLDFKTLQLKDPDGVVVARNPVVGNAMVILHRSRSSEADLLIS
jgi:hypothetical protein